MSDSEADQLLEEAEEEFKDMYGLSAPEVEELVKFLDNKRLIDLLEIFINKEIDTIKSDTAELLFSFEKPEMDKINRSIGGVASLSSVIEDLKSLVTNYAEFEKAYEDALGRGEEES